MSDITAAADKGREKKQTGGGNVLSHRDEILETSTRLKFFKHNRATPSKSLFVTTLLLAHDAKTIGFENSYVILPCAVFVEIRR